MRISHESGTGISGRISGRLSKCVTGGLLAALVVAACLTSGPVDAATPHGHSRAETFYVDPLTGDDTATGTTPDSAWRTLARASEADLQPGQVLALRTGMIHQGALNITASGLPGRPVTIQSYGEGKPPVLTGDCLTVSGDRVVVTGIAAQDCERAGFSITGDDVTLDGVEASGSVSGVWIQEGAQHSIVRDSHIHDNDRMAPGTDGPDDDFGAFGVEVNGDDSLILGNTISGHVADSPDYGRDGAAVEIYQAAGTIVKGNTSTDDLTFTELGGSRTAGTRYVANRVTSSQAGASFLLTRGAGQTRWGPVTGTTARANTVELTGPEAFGFGCYGSCTPENLDLRRNDIAASWYVGYVDGTFTSRANTYTGELWFDLGPKDRWLGERPGRA